LEVPIEFGLFTESKRAENLAMRIDWSHKQIGLLPQFVGYHSVDGGGFSCAAMLELITRSVREISLEYEACYAHQHELAANEAAV
jgi:hypothetical protein